MSGMLLSGPCVALGEDLDIPLLRNVAKMLGRVIPGITVQKSLSISKLCSDQKVWYLGNIYV